MLCSQVTPVNSAVRDVTKVTLPNTLAVWITSGVLNSLLAYIFVVALPNMFSLLDVICVINAPKFLPPLFCFQIEEA